MCALALAEHPRKYSVLVLMPKKSFEGFVLSTPREPMFFLSFQGNPTGWVSSLCAIFNQCIIGQVVSHVCDHVFISSRKYC